MAKKRNQYFIKQFNFSNVVDNNGVLEIKADTFEENRMQENILFRTVYRLKNHKYQKGKNENGEEIKNWINELFTLNATDVKEDCKEIYKRIMKDGVLIDGKKYIRFGKSSSMTMDQRTYFVLESFHDELKETISLNKVPENTVISKYETALGLTMSSANLINGIPKIAIVKDFEKKIIDDVKVVSKVTDIPDLELHQQYDKKKSEFKEKIKNDPKLILSFPASIDEEHLSMSKIELEYNRRVKFDCIDKPVGHKVFKKGAKMTPYLVYSYEQTEEMPLTYKQYLLGYEVNIESNHVNEVNCFDGQGLVSFDCADRWSEELELGYQSQGFQIRMNYIKGLVIKFDLKKWFFENNVTHITDLWNNKIEVMDKDGNLLIDMILTESCFKAKHNKDKMGINQWLFSSCEDYLKSLEKYGHDYIGIANYIKNARYSDIYTPLTYQFINSLNLSKHDLVILVRKSWDLYRGILKNPDTASVKAFLNMRLNIDENEEEFDKSDEQRLDVDVKKAIDIDERMIFDRRVESFLIRQIKQAIKYLMVGRIPVKGNYKYITGDCIAFMEYISGKEVKGFLQENEFFCNGHEGKHTFYRNPITSWHEVKKANLIKSDNEYVQHLDNVIQLNTYDLTMPQLSGADLDGDKIYCTKDRVIYNAVIDDLVVVNKDDKATTDSKDYNIQGIIDFELLNLGNQTGIVTNINTLIQTYALANEDLRSRELEILVCKQLQADIIDSVKKGIVPEIPEFLQNFKKKPYFQKFIYENEDSNEGSYVRCDSPLNELSKEIASKYSKIDNVINYATVERKNLDFQPIELLKDYSKVSRIELLKVIRDITPVFNEFVQKNNKIAEKKKGINLVRSSPEEKKMLKLINKEWKELYVQTRIKLENICDNPSVLTSAAVELAYVKSKDINNEGIDRTRSYLFPWIATENAKGLLENIKSNEQDVKIDVVEVPQLNFHDRTYGGLVMRVKEGKAYFDTLDFYPVAKVKMNDGKYLIIEQMGYHFASFENKRKTEIETTISDKVETVNEDIPKLSDYKATVFTMGLRSSSELKKLINGQVLSFKKERDFLNLYKDDEIMCGVNRKDFCNVDLSVDLNNYIDKEVRVFVKGMSEKSLKISMSSI